MPSSAQVCVIYNPTAGRGRAPQRLQSLRHILTGRAVFQPTQRPGHAEELAHQAAKNGFAIVAAAGGDGTVHEVANGVLLAGRPEVSLAVFPIGSANDYAHSLGSAWEWWLRNDPTAGTRSVDIGLVRATGGRERYFINGLGLGFNGAVTWESRQIQHLQGQWLYSFALLRALWYHFKAEPMIITIDGLARQVPTLAFSAAIGQREGSFVLAPKAIIDDGLFDYLHVGPLRRWELIRCFPGMLTGDIPKDHPKIWLGRCRHIHVRAEAPLSVHLDGELFSCPDDGLRDLEITILPGALRIQGSAPEDSAKMWRNK